MAVRTKLSEFYGIPSLLRPVYECKSLRCTPKSILGSRTASTNVQESKKTHSNSSCQHVTTEKDKLMKSFINRNPRSGELLGISDKPKGFKTRQFRVDYYHRLMLDISTRHVSAYVNHNNGQKVVEASTKEFCISRHLHKTSNVSAAFNIGRVIASRCKVSGLHRVMWEHKKDRKHKKVVAFIKGVQNEGLLLNEPKPRKILPPHGALPR